jgi:hypothetical protein
MHIGYWWERQKERDHWEYQMDLREIRWDGVEWIGWIWIRIGTSGALL